MQKCERCDAQFSWLKIYRSFFGWMYKPINCDACNAEHRITISGRFTFTFLTIFPMIIFVHFLSPFNHFVINLSLGIFLLMIGSLITPFLVTFKTVE